MSYLEIKSEIEKVSSELTDLKISLDKSESIRDHLENQIKNLAETSKEKIQEETRAQEKRFVAKVATPYDRKISEFNDAKSKLKRIRDKRVDEIEGADYAQKFSSDFNIRNEEELCSEIRESIKSFYGEQFYNSINRIKKDTNNSNSDYLISSIRDKSKLLNNSFSLNPIMSKITGGLDVSGDKHKALLVGISSASLLVASVVFYPITLAVITGSIAYNVYRSKFFIECNSACSEFEYNKEKVRKDLNEKIKKAIESDLDRTENEYMSKINLINQSIEKVEAEKELKIEEEKVNFSPDLVTIIESNKEEKASLDDRFLKTNSEIRESNEKIKELAERLEELNRDLNDAITGLTDEYMPKDLALGKELPEDYLIDIKNNKPDLLKRPRRPCLFVYKDREKCNQFIHLFFFQTLLRTDPDLFRFSIINTMEVDKILSFYADSEDKSKVPVIKEISHKEDIQPFLKACDAELRLRKKLIRNYANIELYNSFMLSQECPQETINYLLIKDPNLDDLVSDTNLSIIVNGSDVGYYEIMFIEEKEFNKQNKSYIEKLLEEKIGIKVYALSDTIKPRAGSYFLEMAEN